MSELSQGEMILDRMVSAVGKVRQRLLRAASALEKAGVPYAVVEDNAVAAWVARVDESEVRKTPNVDIMIRRADLEATSAALAHAGFIHRHVNGVDLFLDGPKGKAPDAVHVVLASEKVRPEYVLPAPDPAESEATGSFRVLSLEPLVRMKLTSFRLKDRLHLLDMLEVGLINASWCRRLPPELASRLQELLDNPMHRDLPGVSWGTPALGTA